MNILVTGGSSGLGKSIVFALAKAPNNKVLFTYNKNDLEAKVMVNDMDNVLAVKCDFTNENDICTIEKRIQTFNLDVLINNVYVGFPQGSNFHKTEPELFLNSFKDNLIPTIRLTQNAILGFKAKKFGKIINILTAYLINLPPIGFSIYSANKAYLSQLSKVWNSEYARYNITSNCISPEFMLTNLSVSVDQRIIKQMQNVHPLRKLLTTGEVADTVVYLVNSSQQINGTNIVINAAKNIL